MNKGKEIKQKNAQNLAEKSTDKSSDRKANNIIADDATNNSIDNSMLKTSIDDNISMLKEIFRDDGTLVIRRFENQIDSTIKYCIVFIDGMIDNELVNEHIIRPVMTSVVLDGKGYTVDDIAGRVIVSNNVQTDSHIDRLVEAILGGDTVLLADGERKALIIRSKGWQTRAIDEPEGERILRGPREGFTESLIINLSLIRRKLITPDLKFRFENIGKVSGTKICICYIDGIANEKIISELNKRIKDINIDSAMASGYIQEIIRDSPFSVFKTLGSTERPDIVAAKLLEGRIAIVVEGTPVVLTLPHIFIEFFQSNDDYYIYFYFSSISRILRILCFIMTITLPGIYIALVAFHQEMIPTPLIFNIAAARQGIPFPTVVEAVLLLAAFEILRETGTRMPENIGQALSIVGAIIIGQAAVEARFVSAPMVIIVALTGVTELTIPRTKGAVIIIRLIFIFLSSFLGLYGLVFGISGLLIHLFSLRSFGVPYMLSLMSLNPQDIKDTAVRAPWFYMKYRPHILAPYNRVRNTSRRQR